MYAQRWALVNVYIPPPFVSTILYTILTKHAPFQLHHIVLGGDFNAILDSTLDTSNLFRNDPPELATWADTFGLQEIWRWKHPGDRMYSHVSATHRSGSRIDLMFVTASVLSHVVSYLPEGLSDHSPLELYVILGTARELGCWRLASH